VKVVCESGKERERERVGEREREREMRTAANEGKGTL